MTLAELLEELAAETTGSFADALERSQMVALLEDSSVLEAATCCLRILKSNREAERIDAIARREFEEAERASQPKRPKLSEMSRNIAWCNADQTQFIRREICSTMQCCRIDWTHFSWLSDFDSITGLVMDIASDLFEPYIGVCSSLMWRMHRCAEAGYIPHATRFAYLLPVCTGPASFIGHLEKHLIAAARANGLQLENIGKGGERVSRNGAYDMVLYIAHNDLSCGASSATLHRFSFPQCSCV